MLEKGFAVPGLLHPSLPVSVSWLPQAPGWYLLATLLLLALLVLLITRTARWRRNLWRREANLLLPTLKDADGWIILIKRILLMHRPRADIAHTLSPMQLLADVPLDEALRALLCERYCQPGNQLSAEQNARLAQQIAAWLRSLPHV